MATFLYQQIASAVEARLRCIRTSNATWQAKHEVEVCRLVKSYMPSGAGMDTGTTIDLDKSTGNKLIFRVSFHHMNGEGFYDGWTEHRITVKPDLASGFTVQVSGKDRNQIKEYIADVFDSALRERMT